MVTVSSSTRRRRASKRFSAERLAVISRKLARVSFIFAIATASWSTSSTGERPIVGILKLKLRMASASATSALSGLTSTRDSSQPMGMQSRRMPRVSTAPCQRMR